MSLEIWDWYGFYESIRLCSSPLYIHMTFYPATLPPSASAKWLISGLFIVAVFELEEVYKQPDSPLLGAVLINCRCLLCQSCLTFATPWTRLGGSSVHGISPARIREWVAISFSGRCSWSRDWTHVSYTGRRILYRWATGEACFIKLC